MSGRTAAVRILGAMLLATVAALGAAPGPANAAGVAEGARTANTLSDLLTQLRAVEHLEARYTEEKRMALLVAPVRSEGRMFFERSASGARLARHQTRPEATAVMVRSTELRVRSAAGEVQTVAFAKHPALGLFVRSLIDVLSGDEAALTRAYAVSFVAASDTAPWRLVLEPRDPQLRTFVQRIVLTGRGTAMEGMDVVEAGGDRSTTSFSVVARGSFSPSERKRWFEF